MYWSHRLVFKILRSNYISFIFCNFQLTFFIFQRSIPHAYATVDCDIDFLLSFRKQLKSAGVSVSVNDFVIKAVALALKECPLVNCLYVKDQVSIESNISHISFLNRQDFIVVSFTGCSCT